MHNKQEWTTKTRCLAEGNVTSERKTQNLRCEKGREKTRPGMGPLGPMAGQAS